MNLNQTAIRNMSVYLREEDGRRRQNAWPANIDMLTNKDERLRMITFQTSWTRSFDSEKTK